MPEQLIILFPVGNLYFYIWLQPCDGTLLKTPRTYKTSVVKPIPLNGNALILHSFFSPSLLSFQKIGFILRLESRLLTQGTIRCCYISQTCWRGDLRCLVANCVSVYNGSCRIWTGCTVCCVILSDTFVYRGFFIPTLCVIHVIQLIFTESFHVANRRSHTEFTPFPQCPPPMFNGFFYSHSACSVTKGTVTPTGFVSTHSDGWTCSVTSVGIHWCFAISVTEITELHLLLFVFWNNFWIFPNAVVYRNPCWGTL